MKKAKSKVDGNIYAVKIIRTNDPEIIIAVNFILKSRKFTFFENFLKVKNEYINSSCLRHKNIIRIIDLFIDEIKGKSYYVMEYLNLKSLDHVFKKQKKLTELEIIRIISQILQAVDYMHKKGICHRDIKPKNIMIDVSSSKYVNFLKNQKKTKILR